MDSGKSSPSTLIRSQSLRLSNCNRTSLVRRNQSVSAKQIKFYRNGDRYFSGLKLAVSIDRYKEFDSLLAELSVKLNLSTGAVRCIFNADDGSLVTDISQLQYGISYVCSSSTSYRQIQGGYGKLVPSWSSINRSKNVYRPLRVLGNIENTHSFRPESSKDFIKPKLVTVIRNGKPPQKKVTLLLNSKTAISLDQVLDQLSAKGSLGKVDKLHTTYGKPIRSLRDLFDDNTVFIALSTNEKFPDDGIELDPNSYRITPYREMKKSNQMSVRRSNSLRHNMRYKDENENMSLSSITKNLKNESAKNSSARSGIRPRKIHPRNIEEQKNKEELYPTSVFESESESARAKKKSKKKRNPTKNNDPMDIYNTVWLSDYESVKSACSKSICTSLNASTSSFTESTNMSHSTPRKSNNAHNQIDRTLDYSTPKRPVWRTLSLPELEMATLSGNDLSERFLRLQLEQDNRELKSMVDTLQKSLDQVKHSVFPYDADCCHECMDNRNTLDSIFYELTEKLHKRDTVKTWIAPPASTLERSESGYDTAHYDTLLNMDYGEHDELLTHQSTHSLLSNQDEKYFESRLIKKGKHTGDDSACCIMQ